VCEITGFDQDAVWRWKAERAGKRNRDELKREERKALRKYYRRKRRKEEEERWLRERSRSSSKI
jgi:hypothetical protein